MKYHIISFFAGFLLDLLLGDPHRLPHPVRLIGALIAKTEKALYGEKKERNAKKELYGGICTVVLVLTVTALVSAGILFVTYTADYRLGILAETIMTYQILAVKCLRDESMKVYDCLKNRTLPEARKAVSMIVGRDTEKLDGEAVAKAAIETVAENTSDGVIAPMLYTAFFGPVGGFLYKAVNTMDSMLGYKNDRYLYFGRAAARLDDAVNYLPSRISAYLMMAASLFGGSSFSAAGAFRIYRRDRRKHASPNSAQTESVCAGALGIRLAGDAVYSGQVVKKPYIGDSQRAVEYEDIRRANRLMYMTACICEMLCLAVLAGMGIAM